MGEDITLIDYVAKGYYYDGTEVSLDIYWLDGAKTCIPKDKTHGTWYDLAMEWVAAGNTIQDNPPEVSE